MAGFSFGQAQDRSSGSTPAAQSGGRTAGAGQSQQSQQSQQHDEKEFVKEAAGGNAFEIQLSQFVEQRSQDQQVKQLAQQLIQDHQQAQQQLKQVAQALGAQADEQLTPAQQAKLQEMQKKQGADLDRAYIFCNVGDHHKDVMMYSWEARNAQNPQLKQYCEQILPHLQSHLQHVDRVAMAITGVNDAQTAGERIPGSSTPGQSGASDSRSGASGTSGTNSSGAGSTGRTGTGTSGTGSSGTGSSGTGSSGTGSSGSGSSGTGGSGTGNSGSGNSGTGGAGGAGR